MAYDLNPSRKGSVFAKVLTVAIAFFLATLGDLVVKPAQGTDYTSPLLRTWQRAHEGHLAIEWAKPTRVQQRKKGDRLILRFAEPLNLDIASTLQNLSHFVDPHRSTVDGADLSLALKPGVFSKVNIRERRIVAVDFARNPGDEPRPSIKVSTIDDGVRLTFTFPRPTEFETNQDNDQFRLLINPGWEFDPVELSNLQRTLIPWFHGFNLENDRDRSILSFILKPQIVPSVRSNEPTRITMDLLRRAPIRNKPVDSVPKRVFIPEKKPKTPMVASRVLKSGPPIPEKRPVLNGEPVTVTASETADALTVANLHPPDALVFEWSKTIAAAIFIRANHLWAVFDEPDESFLSTLPASPAALGPGSFVSAEGGTALRYRLRETIEVDVSQTADGHWQIKPVPSSSPPQPVNIERLEGSAALRVTPSSGKRVISIIDPTVGDQLDIMALPAPGIGQPSEKRFVDVELLPTAQGLVWRPLSDRLMASIDDQGLKLHSPKGLTLSAIEAPSLVSDPTIRLAMANKTPVGTTSASEGHKNERPANPVIKEPKSQPVKIDMGRPAEIERPDSYFDLAGSGVERELVNEYRRIRRQAITKVKPEDRDVARLKLARLLVSERLATEARTILSAIPNEADDVILLQKRALNGVSALLIGHFGEASSLLLDPDLNDDNEIDIWRAALESTENQWRPAAERWRTTSDTLDRYPPRLKLNLGLMALRAAIETDDDKMIRRGIRRLSSLPLDPYDEARFDAMKALKAERSGDLPKARALLTSLTDSPHPTIRTLADFELVALELKANANDVDALATLGRRMPLWRGHPDEQTMLDKLARGYVDASAFRKALMVWRRLTYLYPEAADRDDLKSARQETYVRALRNEDDSPIDRIDAYAIYLDFIDLLPGDPEVRSVHRHLAEHLTELDLLDEAIDVLQSLMATADEDVERAELAIEIASLMLRQDRAPPALAILDKSKKGKGTLTPTIDEKERLVRAKILARLDRANDALLTLRGLQSASARRLRAKILWDERRWTRLAATVESYFADADLTSPLTDDDQELVLLLALARQNEDNKDQLRALRSRFSTPMQGSKHAEAFDVATQNTIKTRNIEAFLTATGKQLAELQRFRNTTPTLP